MTATGYSATQQFVEDFAKFKGQTLTLSMWVKSNKAGASIDIYDGVSQTNSSSHTGGGNWEKLTVSHTCSTSTTVLRTEVWTSTGSVVGSYIEFANLQLEVGSVATDFEHRSYGEELALCQRYYYDPNYGSTSTLDASYLGIANNASYVIVSSHFAQSMRVAPSITIYGNRAADAGKVRSTSTGVLYGGSGAAANVGRTGFGFIGGLSGMTAGNLYDSTYIADAEL